MTPEQFTEREIELAGWRVRLTSYRLGNQYYCKADNISPGAWLARATAPTLAEAEEKVLEHARRLLSRTKRSSAA
jgi:nitrogen fixation protein FixH